MRRFAAVVLPLMLISCSIPKAAPGAAEEGAAQEAAAQDTPSARIQAIADAKPDLYRSMKDMKNWRNPYLIVRKDAVGLLDVNNNEERMLKPEAVLQALADLPSSAWPYGRVVAVQEIGIVGSEQDQVEIRRTKGIVAGTLAEVHVVINWVPSA